MKKLLLFSILFLFNIVFTQDEVTHIDFDSNNPDVAFESWNGSSSFSLTISINSKATRKYTTPFVGLCKIRNEKSETKSRSTFDELLSFNSFKRRKTPKIV